MRVVRTPFFHNAALSVPANTWIFPCVLQLGIPIERIADSVPCPPLESSQSQHFPGQKTLFNKLFSKEPGSVGLLFLSFTFYLSLSKVLHLCFHKTMFYVSIHMLWEQGKLLFTLRSHCQKHFFLKSPCFYSIKQTYVNPKVLKVR